MVKKIVLDASTLIALTENCFYNILTELSKKDFRFSISESVFGEAVTTPKKIPKFALNSYRINELVENNTVELIKSSKEIKMLSKKIMNISNNVFSIKKNNLTIVHEGEAMNLAISFMQNAIMGIDERTTRMLLEMPQELLDYLEYKYNSKITLNYNNLMDLQLLLGEVKIVRSTELLVLAFKKKIITDEEFLKSGLYALKFHGCAISFEEIKKFIERGFK